jgi:urease accessory protein
MVAARARVFLVYGLAGLTLLPTLVFAHPEEQHARDALSGLLHPFTGLDHLLAMFAVGLWAVRSGRTAAWTLPLVFPLAMLIGATLAVNAIVLPAIEPMISISVIVLGLLVATRVRVPVLASAALVGLFAICHGYAHAGDMHAGNMIPYASGFMGATLALHAVGIAVGAWSNRRTHRGQYVQTMGSLIALAGAAMLI